MFGEIVSLLSSLGSIQCFAGPGETLYLLRLSTKLTRLSLPRVIFPRGDCVNWKEVRVLQELGAGLSSFSFSNRFPPLGMSQVLGFSSLIRLAKPYSRSQLACTYGVNLCKRISGCLIGIPLTFCSKRDALIQLLYSRRRSCQHFILRFCEFVSERPRRCFFGFLAAYLDFISDRISLLCGELHSSSGRVFSPVQ